MGKEKKLPQDHKLHHVALYRLPSWLRLKQDIQHAENNARNQFVLMFNRASHVKQVSFILAALCVSVGLGFLPYRLIDKDYDRTPQPPEALESTVATGQQINIALASNNLVEANRLLDQKINTQGSTLDKASALREKAIFLYNNYKQDTDKLQEALNSASTAYGYDPNWRMAELIALINLALGETSQAIIYYEKAAAALQLEIDSGQYQGMNAPEVFRERINALKESSER